MNLEYKLTCDDLIVLYMIYKVQNGYEPSFSILEFMKFLAFFEFMNPDIPVSDFVSDGETLFKRFFERKLESHWSVIKDFRTWEKEPIPHMEMAYSEDKKDFIIKANYKLSDYDKSVINTYFMSNKNAILERINNTICEFLKNEPKRKIDERIAINDDELMIGKYVTCEIINHIWLSYIDNKIEHHSWPSQCRDINKYLLELDLASIIDVPSIKEDIIKLYKDLSKRIAILYHSDKNLKISSGSGSYLAKSNYELIIQEYEKIMSIAFSPYNKYLNIDLSYFTFEETHELDGYYGDDEFKTSIINLGNEKALKLVRNIEKQF